MTATTALRCDGCGHTTVEDTVTSWMARHYAGHKGWRHDGHGDDRCPGCVAVERVQRGYDEGIEYAKGMEE
ncbi:MAG: hypothetical protein ACRDO8_13360 [Nocardioidaceae bacterium]